MKIIDIVIMVFIYIIFLFKKWKGKGKKDLLINTLLYFYFIGYLYFTLMPVITSLPFMFNHPYTSMNLNLFDDLINGRGDYLIQIVLNVIMTIPFGFLLSYKKTNINLINVILNTFILSLVTELLQPLISARSADITDLLTNTIGGIMGYLIYRLTKPIIIKYLSLE